MKSIRYWAVVLLVFGVFVQSAQATLMGRLPVTPGGTDYQAAYDDVLDITWVTDADLSGLGNWQTQVDWASNLNYLGFRDWRLASMSVSAGVPTSNSPQYVNPVVTCDGTNEAACRDNELGYMFYENMGGMSGDDLTGTQIVDGVTLTDVESVYWSGTESASGGAWHFRFYNGSQHDFGHDYTDYVWAVRAGDVGAVPEPTTLALMGLGIAGIGYSRKRKSA